MTPDELEIERTAILAELDRPGPITDELRARIDAVAAADRAAAEPIPPIVAAVYEVMAEAVALTDRTLPPGLDVRWNEDVLEILSRGEIISTAPGPGLRSRAAEIAAERAAARN
jgi:hypothetical protein